MELNLPFDLWNAHIFPLLSACELYSLFCTCQTIYSYYNVYQSTCSLPLHRNRRLNRWRKRSDQFKIVLDRIYSIELYDCESDIILIKVSVPDYFDFSQLEVGIHYTKDKWKTVHVEKAKYQKNKYWAIELYRGYGAWFAITAQHADSIVWDNNEGWNYEISHRYHWLPYFYDRERYCYHKYNKPYETIIPALDVWENCRGPMCLEDDDYYSTSDDEDDIDYSN